MVGRRSEAAAFVALSLVVALHWQPLQDADQTAVLAVHREGSRHDGTLAVIRRLTDVGGTVVSAALLAGASLWLLARRAPTLLLYVVVTWVGAQALDEGVKDLLHRARPVVDVPVSHVLGSAFPSGHAVTVTVTFGVPLIVFLPTARSRVSRVDLILVGFLLVVTVGLTRVALGVYFPTDVLGG